MKKASEIFEGENSSLRKTYDEAVKKELKQCTKCHTMKNIEGDNCARCEEKDTESQSGIHSGKDVYGKIEQEIMETFDDRLMYEKLSEEAKRKINSLLLELITLVRNRQKEEILENLKDTVKHTDSVQLKTFLYTDQIIKLLNQNEK